MFSLYKTIFFLKKDFKESWRWVYSLWQGSGIKVIYDQYVPKKAFLKFFLLSPFSILIGRKHRPPSGLVILQP